MNQSFLCRPNSKKDQEGIVYEKIAQASGGFLNTIDTWKKTVITLMESSA